LVGSVTAFNLANKKRVRWYGCLREKNSWPT
jgi:hypothetical protein